jgi:hypothetical protein
MSDFHTPAEQIMRYLVDRERKQGLSISREIEVNFTKMIQAHISSHSRSREIALEHGNFLDAAHHQVMLEAYRAILRNHVFSTTLTCSI